MADAASHQQVAEQEAASVYEFGGLQFDVSFRGRGATLRVLAKSDSRWTEALRFDDFIEEPHFHAPPEVQMPFDRALGEPLAWFVAQVRDHLAEWLERAGFGSLLRTIDVDEVSKNAYKLEEAMIACVPDGYVRVPGVGLRRVQATTST